VIQDILREHGLSEDPSRIGDTLTSIIKQWKADKRGEMEFDWSEQMRQVIQNV
jgi:hypothetical protein